MPLSGTVCRRWAGTTYGQPVYQDMKGDKNAEIGVAWGVRGHLKITGNIAIRQSMYDFLFDFNSKYSSILYRFLVIASHLSKVADFNLPHLHLLPP